MIKNYNDFLNEKLTDNLKGFDENDLKQQLMNGEIDVFKYLKICKQYNIVISDKLLIEKEFEKESFDDILNNSIKFSFKDGIDYVFNKNVDVKIILSSINYLCFNYNDNLEYITIYLINKCKQINEIKSKIESIIHTCRINLFNLYLLNIDFTTIDLNNILITTCGYDSFDKPLKIDSLIEHGADIHFQNEHPLASAIFYNVYGNVSFLLEKGAIVTDKIFNNVMKDKFLSHDIKDIIKKYYNKQHD